MITSAPLPVVFSMIAEARPALRLEDVFFLQPVFAHQMLTLLRRVACRQN